MLIHSCTLKEIEIQDRVREKQRVSERLQFVTILLIFSKLTTVRFIAVGVKENCTARRDKKYYTESIVHTAD